MTWSIFKEFTLRERIRMEFCNWTRKDDGTFMFEGRTFGRRNERWLNAELKNLYTWKKSYIDDYDDDDDENCWRYTGSEWYEMDRELSVLELKRVRCLHPKLWVSSLHWTGSNVSNLILGSKIPEVSSTQVVKRHGGLRHS